MEATDGRPLATVLENRLMSQGVYITDVTVEEGIEMTYESVAPGRGVSGDEVGRILRLLLSVTPEDWAADVEATVLDEDGEVRRGSWHVEAEWFERLHDDLSEVEFSQLVLDSIEVADPD